MESLHLAVADERIFCYTRCFCDRTPRQPFLAELQSVVSVYYNGWPTKPYTAPLGGLLPSNDALLDRTPFQFRNRA